MKKTLTVIIPAKNEEQTIKKVLSELNAVLRKLRTKYRSEVIVVCDNKSDKTVQAAEDYGAKVFINRKGSGKGAALTYGFKKSKGDIIVTMDADYSHRAKDLTYLLHDLNRNKGLVIGSRIVGGTEENEFLRMAGNVFLTLLFGIMFGKFISDSLNGYKVFKRKVIDLEPFTSKGFEVEIEILAKAIKADMEISEVSSHERARAGGTAKSRVFVHGPIILWKVLLEGAKYRFYQKFSKVDNGKN